MPTYYVAPTANFLQKTLSGSITDSATTITLSSTTNMQAPGYIVIDRVSSTTGEATPNSREIVSYTGISGSDLTGCTRGADNSTARAHNDGAIVETSPTVGMWNSLTTIVFKGFTSDGYLKAINSPVSITRLHAPNIINSALTITTSLNVASASVVGITSNVARKQTVTNALISIASTNTFTLVQALGLDGTYSTKLGKVTWNAPLDVPSATNNFRFTVNGDVAFTETLISPDGGGFYRPFTYAFLTTLSSGATVTVDWRGNIDFNKPNGSDAFLIAEQ